MKNILPTKDQIKEFLAMPIAGPIHMINLLKFHEKSKDGAGSGKIHTTSTDQMLSRWCKNAVAKLFGKDAHTDF